MYIQCTISILVNGNLRGSQSTTLHGDRLALSLYPAYLTGNLQSSQAKQHEVIALTQVTLKEGEYYKERTTEKQPLWSDSGFNGSVGV